MARYPTYEDYQKRLESFNSSFPISGIASSQFAEAGFYSINVQDYTRCFYCGVGLRGWDNTDDPWIQHAKFSSNCAYLIEKKGQPFVRNHQQKNATRFKANDDSLTSKENNSSDNKTENDSAISERKLTENEIRLHVRMRMDYPQGRMILKKCSELGIPESSFEKALETRFNQQNDDFENIEEWIEAANSINSHY